MFHWARVSCDSATPLLYFFARGVDIINFNGDMPVCISQLITVLVPVVGQLQHRILRLGAVPEKGEGELTIGVVILPKQLHAKNFRVELDGPIKVAYPYHGVEKSHRGGILRCCQKFVKQGQSVFVLFGTKPVVLPTR